MKKTPSYLKIVKDKNKELKNQDLKSQQLNFFSEEEKEEPVEIFYDRDELNYLLEIFDKILDKTLRNNTVRNTKDLDNLKNAVKVYLDKTIKPLSTTEGNLIRWILITKLVIRLSQVDFKIKKPPYEEDLLFELMKIYFIELESISIDSCNKFLISLMQDEEFMDLPTNWILPFGYLIGTLFILNKALGSYPFLETVLKKVINEGYRKETADTIEFIETVLDSYLKCSMLNDVPLEYVDTLLGPKALEYGINATYIDYLLNKNEIKKIYHMIRNISKKGKLKKYYDQLDPDENIRFRNSIFTYLYTCLCLSYFDYFENIFPIYAKITSNESDFADLIVMYKTYAPIKRAEKFIKKCFAPDSLLSNKIKRIISDVILHNRY